MNREISIGKIFILNLILAINLMSQENNIVNKVNIISPTQFQFLKFGEYPVNEHTGTPNISIPLYNIEIKDFQLPLKLNYNARGIKVSEESDWVGLGWDLSFGSVVQIVYDRDDLDSRYYKRKIPYYHSTTPTTWDYRNYEAPGFTDMFIDNTDNSIESDLSLSFLTFQDYFGGSGNNWDVETIINNLEAMPLQGNDKKADYESDIFIINTPNEKLYVLLKFDDLDTTFLVLNKKGYDAKYHKSSGGWTLTTASGIKYTFNEINSLKSSGLSGYYPWTHTYGDANTLLEQNTSLLLNATQGSIATYSKIWQITNIENIYGESVLFEYSPKNVLTSINLNTQWKLGMLTKNGYTYNYSYTTLQKDPYCESVSGPYCQRPDNYNIGINNLLLTTITTQEQERSYVKKILFNGNIIEFNLSNREDWTNSSRLNEIIVSNNTEIIKTIQFEFNNFESLYIGRGFKTKSNYIGTKDKRLKLDRIIINGIENYNFSYNPEALPSKNSFATDFWGYYNGQIQNRSLIANLSDFEPSSNLNNLYETAFNLNNPTIKYSKLQYTKAGILEKIQYPTGGSVKFYYSLNEFDNYFVPSDPTLTSNHYHGNGLRIDSMIIKEAEDHTSRKIIYNYESGNLQIPVKNYYVKNEAYTMILPPNQTLS